MSELLSVIIPCYNEQKTIKEIINKILNLKRLNTEIIVVDDGSFDDSYEEIKDFIYSNKIKYIKKKNEGKGSAIIAAQKIITGSIVIIQDADLEYDPNDYYKLIDPLKNRKYKVVYGSRILGKNIFDNLNNFSHWFRICGNIFLTKFSNLINRQNLTDAHTCYKVFDAEIFKKISLNEKGFCFCPEITTKVSNMGEKIHEVPISYSGRDYKEGKKIKAIDGLKAILSLIKYKYFYD